MDPIFVAIEGIEGVGKSSMLRIIERLFQDLQYPYLSTREPGGSILAEEIRVLLKSNEYTVDKKTELLMMFAARAHHIDATIQPALSRGISVISDRFVAASYAYQGGGRDVGVEIIKALDEFVCSIHPDITLLLTCPVDVAMERLKKRGEAIDRIESEPFEFFEKAQERYLELARNNDSYIIIDASQSIDKVESQVRASLRERIL